ncbi:MAG: GlxA family transcriptional regulator [Pseudomonadota bacterium]
MTRRANEFTADFLLIDGFSMISFASAVEPLRIANKLLGEKRFHHRCLSIDGHPVTASNGIPLPAEEKLSDVGRPDLLVICSSDGVEGADLPESMGSDLRRLERHGTPLTGICTGSYVLAKFGLLRDRACTIHWEYSALFREVFPEADLRESVFVEDRGLMTCSGGTAPLDLMIRVLEQEAGGQVARDAADIAIHHGIRDEAVHQRLDARARYNVTNPTFLKCIRLMEENIEDPLSLDQLCGHLGISPRQLQRYFKKNLGQGPRAFYEGLRLEHSRQMLRRTSLEIHDVALASGFASTNSFSQAYKRVYGISPLYDRRH